MTLFDYVLWGVIAVLIGLPTCADPAIRLKDWLERRRTTRAR